MIIRKEGKKMKINDINKIDEHVPGLVITPEGKFITMEDENHETFFQNILGPLLKKEGINPRTIIHEHNLITLMNLLLNEFHYLPYQGCTSGERCFNGVILFVPDLKEIYVPQLKAILALVDKMNERYNVSILQINPNADEEIILEQSDILNELNSRNQRVK